mgnify:CR=1 FL=1
MSLEALMKQGIETIAKKRLKFTLIVGTVKEIEGDTCTVDNYEDVRLNAIVDELESQFTIYPKIGSKVVIARLDDSDSMFVVRVSEIDKVTIKIDDLVFEMQDGKFSIKNASANLKSILNDGLTQLDNALIITQSGGTGSFSPTDKAVFNQLKEKVNLLLS